MADEAFIRKVIRWVHIIGGLVVMCYIYSPLGQQVVLQYMMKFVIIPVLTLTGIWIWRFKQVNRFIGIK